MDNHTDNQQHNHIIQKEFWESLQSEILISSQSFSTADIKYFIEKNYMFSLFFRGTTYQELHCFKNMFHMKDSAYLILLELLPEHTVNFLDYDIDEFDFYLFLKKTLGPDTVNAIGPLLSNRICILVSVDTVQSEVSRLNDSIVLSQKLIDAIWQKYQVSAFAGIGNAYTLPSIYTSFLEALTCMYRCQPGKTTHVSNLEEHVPEDHYDYAEAERHLVEAIRLKKVDAYDFFVLMMNYIKPMNDDIKRNKIIEALIIAAHAAQLDGQSRIDYYNYTSQFTTIMSLSGDALIEWAYQKFMYITGFVKPQTSIDYTNKIVQVTKDYLEAHYSEEISLENIAEQVNISPQYFSKLIKKNTGFNFIDWLSMLRVKKAKELLTNSNYTVKEVCFMVGYKDPNYFSRIFKKRIGITPSEYIKNRTYVNSKN